MGLHVFFGCYFNLFRLLAKCGAVDNLLVKEHTHTFCNKGGDVKELDFRFFLNNLKIGAPFHGLKAFFTTPQLTVQDKAQNALALAFSPVVKALYDPEGALKDIRELDSVSFSEWFIGNGGSRGSIDKMWDPIAYALGFIDCDNISARCMLTIFQFFATKTDASVLRMLCGSPENYLVGPIVKYIEERGGKVHTSADVDYSCFADLALTSPEDYYKDGSYTKQDYIDSMEGATLSGRQCAAAISESIPKILSVKDSKEAVTA
eukprot:jgi/Pico_ML_1/56120/g1710.t1